MKTDGTPLHGSYFDLAATKHPDLKSPERGVRRERPKHRRSRFGPIPAVFCGTLVGVIWLAITLRPEPGVRLTAAERGSAATQGLRPADRVASDTVANQADTVAKQAEVAPAQDAPRPPAEASGQPPLAVRRDKPIEAPTVFAVDAPGDTRALDPPAERRQQVVPPKRQQAVVRPPDESAVATGSAEPPAVSVEPPAVAAFLPARKISAPPLVYPEAARRAGEQGTVLVEAEINGQGVVTGTTIVRGHSPALDAAAAAALETWRFEPARRGDVAVESTYRVGIKFALSEAEVKPATPLEVGGEVEPPRRLEGPMPAYPNAAWVEGVAGDVLVRAVIDEKGEVADVKVLKGLPHGMTEAAVEAIRRWKFAPATRHGQPVAVYRNLSVRFEG